jgi:hypothetical protein
MNHNYYTIACYLRTGRTTTQYMGRLSPTGTFVSSEYYADHFVSYADAVRMGESLSSQYDNVVFSVCDCVGNTLTTFDTVSL